MALSVTAAVDPVLMLVRLTVTGGTAPYVVDAAPSGGRAGYRVRSAFGTVAGAPSTRTATDGDVPLNTDVLYVATDALGAQANSNSVILAASLGVLSDATNPNVLVPVTVVRQLPNEWSARSVWWDVLGATAPFASVAPMRLRAGDILIRTDGPTERAGLLDLLATGNPFVLRTPWPDTVDDVVGLIEQLREEPVLEDDQAGARHFTLAYQAVSRQLGIYTDDTGRTYALLPVEAATYTALLGLYGSYDAVLLGDPSAGLGAEQVTDGAFAGGVVAPWDTFWSGVSVAWSSPGGVAHALSSAAGQPASLEAGPNSRAIPAGPKVLRVTGRVRSTSPTTVVRAELLTNLAATGAAQYFAAGVVNVQVPISAGASWQAFAIDMAVSDPTDDVWSLFFRGNNMPSGAVIEWDDLSARWRT